MSAEKDDRGHDRRIWIISGIIFCIMILIPISFLFITPRPTPSFTLHDVKLYAWNFSTATSTLTSNLQITISSRNNGHSVEDTADIYFEKVDVYASYKNQPITLPTMIPWTYLGQMDVTAWSLYLNGTDVPVPPYLATSLAQDVTAGTVLIYVELTGKLRLKRSGSFSLGRTRYRVKVKCSAYVVFNKNDSNVVGSAVKHPFVDECHRP